MGRLHKRPASCDGRMAQQTSTLETAQKDSNLVLDCLASGEDMVATSLSTSAERSDLRNQEPEKPFSPKKR